jgi:hypothetical protein
VKAIAKEWEKIDEKRLERLKADFQKEMVTYTAALQKYDSLLTEEQRDEVKYAKQELRDIKEKKKLKKVM